MNIDVFNNLYERFDGYTWYIQSVLNRLYEQEKDVTNYQQVQEAINNILTSRNDQYEMLMTFLSNNQRLLIKAIAKENMVKQLQATDFIRKYELPNSSSIKKAVDALMAKDLIYYTQNGYIIYDRFFDLWLKRLF